MGRQKGKNPVGRPSELNESLEKAKEYLLGGYSTVGDVVPSIAGLSCYLGKSRSTVYEYGNKSDEFSDILEAILAMQENKLLNKGLTGEFNSTITKLMLGKHGYSDKQNHEVTGKDGGPLQQVTYTPDDYKKAQQTLEGELEGLD